MFFRVQIGALVLATETTDALVGSAVAVVVATVGLVARLLVQRIDAVGKENAQQHRDAQESRERQHDEVMAHLVMQDENRTTQIDGLNRSIGGLTAQIIDLNDRVDDVQEWQRMAQEGFSHETSQPS